MTISLIFKIAAVGILVSILSQVLKHSGRDEQAFIISLAGLVLVLLWVVPCLLYTSFQSRTSLCFRVLCFQIPLLDFHTATNDFIRYGILVTSR